MPEVEREPESNAGPVNGGGNNQEKRNRRAPTPQQAVCDHPRADLQDRHCRDCGSELTPVPVAGIDRRIDARLRELGLVGGDGRPVLADGDGELRAEHKALIAAANKQKGRLFGPGDTKYREFSAYKAAVPEDRAAELRRFDLEPSATETKAAPKRKSFEW